MQIEQTEQAKQTETSPLSPTELPAQNGRRAEWFQAPQESKPLRLRDLNLKALVALIGFLFTLFSMAGTALWAVYERPTETKVQRMLDRGFQRIDKRLDRQDKRLDRLDNRIRDVERRK